MLTADCLDLWHKSNLSILQASVKHLQVPWRGPHSWFVNSWRYAMEKRGTTGQADIRQLIKEADSEEKVFVINMDGFRKHADSNKDKSGLVIIATGHRAEKLRSLLKDILE